MEHRNDPDADLTATTTSHDGTTLAYDIAGDGPPLIYVTGATCHRSFGPVRKDARTFASAFRVLTYDRRGRGDSGDVGPWSLDKEVDDLEAMIDALGGRAYVYGHSSGAVIALHGAHRLADKVLGTVLYDASWVADERERDDYAVLRGDVRASLDDGRPAAALRRFLVGIGMPRIFTLALPLTPGWRTMVDLAPTLLYDMELTADLPPLDVASEVPGALHVLVGERSPRELHVVASDLARASRTQVTALAKQNHLVAAKAILAELTARCGTTAPGR